MSDICIVSPPFSPIEWPSLGIGQLIAAAKNTGLDARALYLSLRFAKKIGYPLYSFIIGPIKSEALLGEWFFSKAAFDGIQFPHEKYPMRVVITDNPILKASVEELYAKDETAAFWKTFNELPQIAGQFIEDSAREIVEENPIIVGCSTSFQQYNASLAFLRHVKRLNPAVVTMVGGANCEAEGGYITLKNFPWIDFVVSGEADSLFPKLCQAIYEYGTEIPLEKLPYGVYSREKLSAALAISNNGLRSISETAIEYNLDNIPIPDYSDYFEELQRAGFHQEFKPLLMMETSRGCWKGSRKHCNFCGLNGMRLASRQKSPERVLHELSWLSKTYDIREIKTADCILSMNYFNTLFKELAHQQAPYKLSFETSSSLSERQVKALADAGVSWIQPGIESLHDDVLKLLNKGNSAIQNIALLKYALENNIAVYWNILCDIPGEQDAYYQNMVDLAPLLYHLQPPNFVQIRFDRFSEYFERSEDFGLTLVPHHFYQYVYPFDQDDLETFAYFFEKAAVRDNVSPSNGPGRKQLHRLIYKTWRRAFYTAPKAELLLSEVNHHTVISDTRPCAIAPEFCLTGIEHFIYKGCRKPVTRSSLYRSVCQEQQGRPVDECMFEDGLQQLIEKKLLVHINGRYLALATLKPKKQVEIPPPNRLESFLNNLFQKQGTRTSLRSNKTWEWFESLENG